MHIQENEVRIQLKFYLDEIMEYYSLELIRHETKGYALIKKSLDQANFRVYINDILKEMEG